MSSARMTTTFGLAEDAGASAAFADSTGRASAVISARARLV
jgi:hypothetical protein